MGSFARNRTRGTLKSNRRLQLWSEALWDSALPCCCCCCMAPCSERIQQELAWGGAAVPRPIWTQWTGRPTLLARLPGSRVQVAAEWQSPPSGSRHRSVARRANSYCSQAIATRLRWQWRAEARSVEGGEKGSENQRWTRESRAEESGESARQIPARRLLTTREGIFAFSVVWGGGLDQQLRRRRPAVQSAAVSVSRSGRSRWHCRNRKHTATGRKGQRWSPAQREHPNDALLGPSLWLWLETPKRWSAVRSKAVPSLIQSWSHHSQILVLYVFSLCLAGCVPVSSSAPRVSQVGFRKPCVPPVPWHRLLSCLAALALYDDKYSPPASLYCHLHVTRTQW